MRFTPLLALSLLACKGDLTIVEAENDAPTVNATVLGGPFFPGEAVTVQAVANDPDPDQDWTALTVSIDVEGAELEAGDPVEVDGGGEWTFTFAAEAGLDSATVTAVDAFDASASDTVSIELADNAPPTLAFDSPVANARYPEGSSVLVEITATDAEDREQDLALSWTGLADLSAAPANPDASGFATFTATGLANGTYTLGVTVEDSAGDQVSRSRSFELVDPDADGDGDLALEFGGTDCDDTEASVNGSGTEICDGLDNDCDGTADNDATDADTWYTDGDNDGYGAPSTAERACAQPAGKILQGGDCNDNESAVYPGNPEICDGLDNDCAAGVDDGLTTSNYYHDSDGDTYGAGTAVNACVAPADHVARAGDCNDNDAAVNPGVAVDDCNGVNNDCDGQTDEDEPPTTYYLDSDGDDYGVAGTTTDACTEPANYAPIAGDCDDDDSGVNPGATETCNGVNDDCNNGIDEGFATTDYFYDSDGDNYGAGSPTAACQAPGPRWMTDGGDCNDSDTGVNPGVALDDCNGVNNDCDSQIDEDEPATTYYFDGDGDDYGISGTTTEACTAPNNYATVAGDCDDDDSGVNPGATETCNGVNDDCNNGVDEGFATSDWFYDNDGDDYGTGTPTNACAAPGPSWKADGGDCNDNDTSVHPNALDDCNEVNNDCDSLVDEDEPPTEWWLDDDGDLQGDSAVSQFSCTQPTNYVANSDDCDDGDEYTYLGADELCDGYDNDCDPNVDEGLSTSTWYYDQDGDGVGGNTAYEACAAPLFHVGSTGDCDDNEVNETPGGTEVCGDGYDNDCVGGDEACNTTDYSGLWTLYEPGTNNVLTIDEAGCTAISFSFSTVRINDLGTQIEVIVGDDVTIRVNGCEAGFTCDNDGMFGPLNAGTPDEWNAADSIEPFLNLGWAERYYWRGTDGSTSSSSFVQFTDPDTFRGTFVATYVQTNASYPVPAQCRNTDVWQVEGRR